MQTPVIPLYQKCTFGYGYCEHSHFNAGIKSLRATLPAEIFLLGILIFKGLTARRLYKSFGVKGLNMKITTIKETERVQIAVDKN
jgi:hypothetical protein